MHILYRLWSQKSVGVKIGAIAPRLEIQPTYLAFRPSVLTITPPRFTEVTTLPKHTGVISADYYVYRHIYIYIHTYTYIYTHVYMYVYI